MVKIIGIIVVLASVLGGFVLSHGQIMALWQPYELLVIGGAALGGFLIAFVEVGAAAFGFGRWGGAIVFSLLVIFLIFRPTGILGSQTGDRA